MIKRKKIYLSNEERTSQINLIVSIHNTLNMMQERSVDRKNKYRIEAVTVDSSENEENTPRLETKYVKLKNKTVDTMYVNVLEKQQILALQTTLQEEQGLLYQSQKKSAQDRRRATLNGGMDNRSGVHRTSSSHSIDQKNGKSGNDAWLTVKGTRVPGNSSTSTQQVSPRRLSSESESKPQGTQSRKSRSNTALNQKVTVRPEVNFTRDAAIRKSKRQEKEEKDQKRWDGIKQREIAKWDNLEVKPKPRSQSTEPVPDKSENKKKNNKDADIAKNNDGSGEHVGGMMKFIYAPFFWLRKSRSGE